MDFLRLDNLSKSYGALRVTEDMSLSVQEGEIVGILGPNGAGKSTLFNLVTGTVRPNSGRVHFRGQDVTALDASQRCRLGISRSFQIPQPFGGMTVFENVLVGSTFGGTGGAERAAEVLDLTGLKRRANDKASSLTLLERKRLEMARALATNPSLLLLDEIAGGLTERECIALLDAIRAVHATGVTIVWIEHVVHALMTVAQRLVVIDFGRKIADGAPAEVLASKDVQSVYMGADEHV